MFSQKLFRFAHKIALFAIVFASLAPSISHALAAKNSTSFAQEICTTSGQKISIQVVTSQGQQLTTEFSVGNEVPVQNVSMHLEHCPFCSAGGAAALLPSKTLEIIALLEISAQKIAKYAVPIAFTNTYQSPPSHAPPSL